MRCMVFEYEVLTNCYFAKRTGRKITEVWPGQEMSLGEHNASEIFRKLSLLTTERGSSLGDEWQNKILYKFLLKQEGSLPQ